MSVKQFKGGTGPIVSDYMWSSGTYPQPGDQLIISTGIAWAANVGIDAFINLGAPVPQDRAPTLSIGDAAVNVFLDPLTGPLTPPNQAAGYQQSYISTWGDYDVLNLGDASKGAGAETIITTAQGNKLWLNEQMTGTNHDLIFVNGSGFLSNYGTSRLYLTDETVSIPTIGSGLWVLQDTHMQFNNVFVAPSETVEVDGHSVLTINSPDSAVPSPFEATITSHDFENGIAFNGPQFTAASYADGVLTLSGGGGPTQQFKLALQTAQGAPSSFSVYQTPTGVELVAGISPPPQGAGPSPTAGNEIGSYIPLGA